MKQRAERRLLVLRHGLRAMLRRVFAAVHQEFLNGNMEGAAQGGESCPPCSSPAARAAEQIAQGGVRDAALPGKFRLGQAPGSASADLGMSLFFIAPFRSFCFGGMSASAAEKRK